MYFVFHVYSLSNHRSSNPSVHFHVSAIILGGSSIWKCDDTSLMFWRRHTEFGIIVSNFARLM